MKTCPLSACLHRNHLASPLGALWLLAIVCCLGPRLGAQSAGTGVLSGRVINDATGEVLDGAMLAVEGTSQGGFSEPDGTFRLTVPAGSYTLRVEFTGLQTVELPVTVTAGATATANVRLTSEVYKLDKVTVHSILEGSAQALQEQREMPNLAAITSTDAFGIPSPNPGELVMTLPEVSVDITGSTVRTIYVRGLPSNFTSLMIDGNLMAASQGTSAGRQFQIEQYNTSQLQEAQIVFEPTPDMDGDQIGGVLNLVTKRIYDMPNVVQLTLATNWIDSQDSTFPTQMNPGHVDFNLLFNHTYSVFGGEKNLGIEFNLNENAQGATIQDEQGAQGLVSAASGMLFPGVGGNTSGGPIQTDYGHGFLHYNRPLMKAGGFDVDYKFGPDASLSVRTTYNNQYYNQQFTRWWAFTSASYASYLPGSTPSSETTLPTAATGETVSSNFTKKSLNYSVNPEFVATLFGGSGTLDVSGMYSYANIWYPGYQDVTALDRSTGFSLNRVGAGAFTPIFTQTAGPSYTDPASYVPTSYFRYTYGAPDELVSGRADYTQHLDTPFPSFIKAGIKYSGETRTAYNNQTAESVFSGPTTQGITPWLGSRYVMDGYGPYPFLNIPGGGASNDLLTQGDFSQAASDAFSSETNSLAAIVHYQEDLSEAYTEASVTLGKLTLLGGVRVEHTAVEGQTHDKTPGAANAALTVAQNYALAAAQFGVFGSNTSHYTNYLPGLFATYQPFSNTVIKGSYTVTVTRPPVTDLIPGQSINPANLSISVGNPGIQPYTAQNWDLNIAQYFEPIGQFSGGVFVKQIKNYIATETGTVGGGQFPAIDAEYDSLYPGYTVSSFVNYGTARFRGVYFAYQQQFTSLPGLLRGIGLFGNMTFLETQGNYGGTVNYENLAGFTPFSANYGISYVHLPVQLWLNANYRGNYLFSGNALNINGGIEQLHRTQVTLSGDYVVDRNWDLFFNITNLTNEYSAAYVYDNVPYGAYLQGIGFVAGFRFTYK